MAKQIVPPFSKEDIVEIIRDALANGTFTAEPTKVDSTKTYVLKVVNGVVALVEEQGEE